MPSTPARQAAGAARIASRGRQRAGAGVGASVTNDEM